MNKLEFLAKLGQRISSLPEEDIKRSLEYYGEMIDDRVEDGLSENEAVAQLGNMDDIASQILSETSLAKTVKRKANPRKTRRAWEIVLLVLGSPIWISLAAAAFAAALSLYVSLWSVIISLWAVLVSLVACVFGVTAAGIAFAFNGNGLTGIAMIGAGFVCAGLSVFVFFGCKAVSKGTLLLTKKIAFGVKRLFVKKEVA